MRTHGLAPGPALFPLIGKSFGPYRLLAALGTGGMGEVYRALDTRLDREVAIKFLPESLSADPERLSRFKREAKLLASLTHPRIASIYSMEVEARTPFLVLELVEGESLAQRLLRGPLTVAEATHVGRQVAEALAAAHDAGVVHRDLKPANVMIAPATLGVKVLDFGIAKTTRAPDAAAYATRLTRTGTLLGTAPYISPEHLLNEPADHRADIWAFGCLMFEVLTARSAFARPTEAATIAAVLGAEPDWKALPERTPSRLVDLLRSCLCKDPGRRLARMQDAIVEIDAARAQLAGVAPDVRGRRVVRWALAAGGSLAAIAIYTSGFLASVFAPSESGPSAIGYLAVLPFEYQSADRAQEYVAAAMTDQLTTSLGSINGLRVLGRQSARAYEPTSSPIEFARQQRLDALITGAVFHVGPDVRVTVQLLDGRTGDQIWADGYRGTAGEILALADSTVRSVGRAIGALTSQEAQSMADSPAVDPAALSAYWLGAFYMQDYTEEAMSQAIRAFEEAIAIAPRFAAAHAARARARMLMVQQGFRPASEFYPLARAGMDLALSLDSMQAEVLTHDATLKLRTGRDWSGLKEQFETALQLNPNSGDGWHEYSHFLEAVLDSSGALRAARRYREVEPRTRGPWFHLANVHRNRREWSNVVAVADSGLAVYPSYYPLRITRARALVRLGQTDEAIRSLESVLSVSRDPIAMGTLAVAYIASRNTDRARALQAELHALGQWEWVSVIHALLGELDDAFVAARQAVEANQGSISFLHIHTELDSLRADCARWRQLLAYAGFPADLIERSLRMGRDSPLDARRPC
jgi:TolB-like protein/tetratricopeptide (TPR) repeat protein